MAKRKRRPSGQERAQAEARRIAAQRERKRKMVMIVAALLAFTFLASTIGAIVASSGAG